MIGKVMENYKMTMAAASVSRVPDFERLVIISYNLHGFNRGVPGLQCMISDVNPDAIFIQEHWLTPANIYK